MSLQNPGFNIFENGLGTDSKKSIEFKGENTVESQKMKNMLEAFDGFVNFMKSQTKTPKQKRNNSIKNEMTFEKQRSSSIKNLHDSSNKIVIKSKLLDNSPIMSPSKS